MNEFDMETLHRVFHQAANCRNGICKEHPMEQDKQIEDGSWLRMFTCLKCGKKVHIGINNKRQIVQQEAP
jgi:hypothetical protein